MSRAVESLWYPPREGPGRRLALSPLTVASVAYGAVARARAALFRSGALTQRKVDGVRVISVGNLNVGGAGKTPAVIALAQRLSPHVRVAVATRGYGRRSAEPVDVAPGEHPSVDVAGDEPLLIAARTGVPVLVDSHRTHAAERARDRFGAQLVLLDDGFQHLRLHRDLDLLVVDEAVGFGNGHLFPRGPLREPVAALGRAGLIWIRGSDHPVPLPRFDQPVVRTRYLPSGWVDPSGTLAPLGALEGKKVVALCALARPGSFERTLEPLGIARVATFAFADHHRFSASELERVRARADAEGAVVVTTEKDRVRLPPEFDTYALRLDVVIEAGAEHLDRLLLGG